MNSTAQILANKVSSGAKLTLWTIPVSFRGDGRKLKWKTNWGQVGPRLIRCIVSKDMCGGRHGQGIMFVCRRPLELWLRERVGMGGRILHKILRLMGRLGQRLWGRLFPKSGVCM